jgi:phosphoribosylamine---glycine ligase
MKKILLIGNGAREHVIAETLKKSSQDIEIFTFAKARNPGLLELSADYELADLSDKEKLKEFVEKVAPDFCVVGPENPITDGICDFLLDMGIPSCSPLQTVGRLESSKSFARDLLEKYGIPGNPKFKVFHSEEGLEEFFDELGDDFVVKADGLKGGKGVKVAGDHLNGKEEGLAYARECLEESGKVVVDEKLIGQEFSLMSFCDGIHNVFMPCVQDHKRAFIDDKGPNTGGMGSYSCENHSMPFLQPHEIEEAKEITEKVTDALYKETGSYFKGILYGGFIATKNGVKLIEYNARFGDPEAMNVLPLLKTDFVAVCEAQINGTLDELEVEFEEKATVCKYVVPNGYPDNPCKDEKIEVGQAPEGVLTYFASIDKKDDGLYLSGSRAIAFVGIADTLAEAEKLAQSALETVKGPVFYREDIGTAALVQKRVDMMKEIHGN